MSKRSFDFGRVFFPKNGHKIPQEILFQPLGNHVSNVRKLVHYWNLEDFPTANPLESQKRVSLAAHLHDIGKPQKFKLTLKLDSKKQPEFSYSFRGHRFLAESPNQPWVEMLAKGHHDFSVGDICRDTYILKNLAAKLSKEHPNLEIAERYKDILTLDSFAYARELFILEMCDQIEAEIACRFFEDKEQAESRAFMDFNITEEDSEKGTYYIDPWIFKQDEFELTLAHWVMPTPESLKKALEAVNDKTQDSQLTDQLNQAVKEWWQSQSTQVKSLINHVKIRRLPKDNLEKSDPLKLYQVLGKEPFSPNKMQKDLAEALDPINNPNPAIILKAPTSSGKTEAILFPALANDYRLFLVLPTRSLLEDQKERIESYLIRVSNLTENKDREISLVVDTGAQMDRWLFTNGAISKPKVNSRRHLYKGNVILTTLDKFLYRYFSFGDKQKSFVFPHRIHHSNHGKTLICFDESHSYDEVAFTNFSSLVKSLYEAGRSLVLMTATMPEELSKQLDYLETFDYINHPELNKYHRERDFEWFSNVSRDKENLEDFQNNFTQIILNEWNAKPNRRILAVVETVKDAVEIYKNLKDILNVVSTDDRFLFLYHGRIADQLRPELYKQIKQRDDLGQPYILVTTSAIEVGCDLNSEVLISEICPPENLIQRAGRCNRKGNIKDAKVILVGDKIQDFANSLDDDSWTNYAETLVNLINFDSKQISECISRSEHIDDYRVVELFSMLHEYVYGADLTCQPIHKKGLIPTRSWTPSVTLEIVTENLNNNMEYMESKKYKTHSISIPVDRLARKNDQVYASISVYERRYNQETSEWNHEHPLTWGEAYRKDITVKISPEGEGAQFDTKEPYPYDPEIGFEHLPKIFTAKWVDGADIKLKYEDDKHKAIIWYTKSMETETYFDKNKSSTSKNKDSPTVEEL
ncbi:CRISPR-associated helicase Cas3' [Pseudanabaena mucicola]|uniref:CRISPR-associated helicase Cas3' n=1 Tax=Pseudanabaena mucicola TaxID=71190 RepID=UPI0025768337|nr:CRISPR-associated helicase Cas3' [Pseudanabaena mucicola]